MDANLMLSRYFDGKALEMISLHGKMVAELSARIAIDAGLDTAEICFVEEAAMLHDVGVCRVCAPEIGLCGSHPYIRHGVLGREILESEGMPRHALVCERHIGVGLTAEDIISQQLPLPVRDMTPRDPAEEIICFADLFYSKKPGRLEQQKSPDKVRRKLASYGEAKLQIFDRWFAAFGSSISGD
ncbi:MAG TPA: phosphohydrolase [Deltaproteobacteria bacterium]|nr:phosphohydrolase [Deltaproteobacteria bacterium]